MLPVSANLILLGLFVGEVNDADMLPANELELVDDAVPKNQ